MSDGEEEVNPQITDITTDEDNSEHKQETPLDDPEIQKKETDSSPPPPDSKEPDEDEKKEGETGLVAEVLEAVGRSTPSEEKEDEKHEEEEVVQDKEEETPKEEEGEENKEDKHEQETVVEKKEEDVEKKEEDVENKEEDVEKKEEVDEEPKQKEEPIVTPHLLTGEEIIAKGVAESDIDNYRKFYLKQAYSPKAWYETIKDHTFETEFIVLSFEEIDALLAKYHSPNDDAPNVDEQVNEVLKQLSEKIDTAINKFGEAGAFIKLNTHSPKDAVLDKNEPEYIQELQNAILTELEIEQQFANAYLIWRSWRSSSFRHSGRIAQDGVLRRSFRRIQTSLNRPRTQRPARQQQAKLESDEPLAEEPPKQEEKKTEEKREETKLEGDKDEDKGKDEGEDKGAEPVVVEATVEGEEKEGEKKEEEKEDEVKEEVGKEDGGQKEEPETVEVKETDKSEEIEKKEEIGEDKVEDKPVEDTTKEDKDDDVARRKPRSLLQKNEQSEEHQIIRVKAETRGNKVLRAFNRATIARYQVTSGSQAIDLLTTSNRIRQDLEQIRAFANISGTEAVLSVRRWHDREVAKYPGMEFRGFVYKNKLNALSQCDDIAYIPNIARYKPTIENKIQSFFDNVLCEALKDQGNYVVDIFVAPNKIYVVDLNPFYTGTGACLFTWQQNKKIFLGVDPLEFRHIATPYKQCFTGLHTHWQQVCENVVQQKTREDRHERKCVIL